MDEGEFGGEGAGGHGGGRRSKGTRGCGGLRNSHCGEW